MQAFLSIFILLASSPTPAQEPDPIQLEPVVVVATRSPRPISSVAGMVTVIDAARTDREQVRSIGDMVRYEVGVSPETAGTRFGLDGFNIRGIGGNRVAIEVDGVPVGDHFDIGSFASAGRALIDPEFIQRVEILRGPASTLYGSDAIGGIAAFYTWDPAALAGQGTGNAYYRLRSGYDGADDSAFASLLGTHSGSDASVLGTLVYREGDQADHSVAAGDQDRMRFRQTAALGKVSIHAGTLADLALTATRSRSDRESDIRSILGAGRFRRTTLLLGDDTQERDRLTLEYELAPAVRFVDDGWLRAYYQDSETDQFTIEERAASDLRRSRRFLYDQETVGFEAELFKRFNAFGADHRLGYGVDLQTTDTAELRDAVETNLAGGNATSTILGEAFPVRDFPNTETTEAAVWVQDEITFDRLTLIPALRYEHYSLDPSPDSVYREDHPDLAVVSVSADEITPRLGLLYDVSDRLSLFGQYARGFRAPPFEDANIGLDIPLFNIRAIPNPDLVPESSDGFEVGLRHVGSQHRLEVVAFYSDYDDFIESKVNLGPDPDTGTLIFQSRNLAEAEIYGLELRHRQTLDHWMRGLAWHASAFWADGEDKRTGAPLAGLDPPEAVVGLRWSSPDVRWHFDVLLRAAAAKDDIRVPEQQFVPAGYGALDILAEWRPRGGLKLGAGLFNAFNREHWNWQAVRGLAPGDPTLPLVSQPGRSFAATVEFSW